MFDIVLARILPLVEQGNGFWKTCDFKSLKDNENFRSRNSTGRPGSTEQEN